MQPRHGMCALRLAVFVVMASACTSPDDPTGASCNFDAPPDAGSCTAAQTCDGTNHCCSMNGLACQASGDCCHWYDRRNDSICVGGICGPCVRGGQACTNTTPRVVVAEFAIEAPPTTDGLPALRRRAQLRLVTSWDGKEWRIADLSPRTLFREWLFR